MRHLTGLCYLGLLLGSVLPLEAAGRPIYTNKSRFRIPYNSDPAEMRKLGAREIRLYVSEDRGAKWEMAQSVPPDTGKFQYQAPKDGEYWFSVRTVDGQDRMYPDEDVTQPGLIVVVDTTPPKLDLRLTQVAPGRVALAWTSDDTNLDPAQLKMEFIQPGTEEWQLVGIVPKAADSTEWSVPGSGSVAVRGMISDLAGNVGRSETRIDIASSNQPVSRPTIPDLNQPVANQPSETETASNETPLPPGLPTSTPVNQQQPGEYAATQGGPTMPEGSGLVSVPGTAPAVQPGEAAFPTSNRPLTNFVTSTRTNGINNYTPNGRKIRMVNSRQFNIAYKLQDVGPSGVSSVEMYVTRDDGATWNRYGEDPDRTSPFSVIVPDEGQYGLNLVVRSGVGLAADPPQPGERPSMVIQVDQTAPLIELLPIEQGQGATANNLLIRWRTREDHPAEKPVFLYYSISRQGPWQPIALGMDDIGQFAWSVGPNIPTKFFLRLEIRDSAGNLARVETPEPLMVDLSRPTADIVDIEAGLTVGPQ